MKMRHRKWVGASDAGPTGGHYLGTIYSLHLLKLLQWVHYSFFFFKFYYYYYYYYYYYFEREWESARTSGGGSEREGEREYPKQAPHCQYRAGCGARTHKPWDHDLSRNQELNAEPALNWLSHPGAPGPLFEIQILFCPVPILAMLYVPGASFLFYQIESLPCCVFHLKG